jgi:DNA-binding NarL/FixJ family response regulator
MNNNIDRPPIRLGIIEDDVIIREGFENLLRQEGIFVMTGSYKSCEDFLKNIDNDKPEVVIVDIELPGMSGIEGIKKIKKINPNIQAIVVTVYENDELVFKALCAGAGGYLTKNNTTSRIKDAILELMDGGAPMSTNIARMVVASFQKNMNTPLSGRETEVLELLAKGKSYTTIASELYIDKETVRSHIKNIYFKLEVHSKAEALDKAKKEKWI